MKAESAQRETATAVSNQPTTVTPPPAAESGGRGSASSARSRAARDLLGVIFARFGVIIAFGLMILAFSLARPHTFPTVTDLKSILTAAAPGMIVALGLTVALVMQDFDLSIGSMVRLADRAAVLLNVHPLCAWQLLLLLWLLPRHVAGPGR